jgi:hypothetical protein
MSQQIPPEEKPASQLTDRQVYNLVSDTAIGVNIRRKDNLYQALAIFVCLLLGILIGFLVMSDPIAGLFVGGFVGLLVGLLSSGIFLMVYRFIRHIRGQHD